MGLLFRISIRRASRLGSSCSSEAAVSRPTRRQVVAFVIGLAASAGGGVSVNLLTAVSPRTAADVAEIAASLVGVITGLVVAALSLRESRSKEVVGSRLQICMTDVEQRGRLCVPDLRTRSLFELRAALTE